MTSTMALLKFIIYFWFIPNLYLSNEKKTKSLDLVHNRIFNLPYITQYVIATHIDLHVK